MLHTCQGSSFRMHSQHISPLCPQTPGLSLFDSAFKSRHLKPWQRKRTWWRMGGDSSVFIPAPGPIAVFTWVSSSCELAVFQKRQPRDWLLMSQVRAIAYLCCLLRFYVDKLQVHSRCHWTQGSAEARYFREWPIGTVICGSGFKRFYLSENPIEQMESYISVHNVVNICFLFFHNVVNIYNKRFIWCSQVCCDCIWRQWGLFPKGIYLVLKKMWLCFLV